MNERFIQRIDKFDKKLLDVPPTLEELQVAFPHKAGCGMATPLAQSEEKVYVYGEQSGFGYFPGGYDTRKYLECGECHVKERYSE